MAIVLACGDSLPAFAQSLSHPAPVPTSPLQPPSLPSAPISSPLPSAPEAATAPQTKAPDPIVGRWSCSIDAQIVTYRFQADGTILVSSGDRGRWRALGNNRYSAEGVLKQVRLEGDGLMKVVRHERVQGDVTAVCATRFAIVGRWRCTYANHESDVLRFDDDASISSARNGTEPAAWQADSATEYDIIWYQEPLPPRPDPESVRLLGNGTMQLSNSPSHRSVGSCARVNPRQ